MTLTVLSRVMRLSSFPVSGKHRAPLIDLLNVTEELLHGGTIFPKIGRLDDLHQVLSGCLQQLVSPDQQLGDIQQLLIVRVLVEGALGMAVPQDQIHLLGLVASVGE